MNKLSAILLLLVLSGPLAPIPTSAAVEVETNHQGWSCGPLLLDLRTRWMDFKRHMLPPGGEVDRPGEEDFVCLTPQAVRDATPRNVMTSANVRCFSARFSQGLGICCDQALSACAQLNPGLFPDLNPRASEAPEPPKSRWVAPPPERDQWQSN